MTNEKLKDALQHLHAELKNHPADDAETQALLSSLSSEIQHILATTSTTTPTPATLHSSAESSPMNLVQSISANIATKHPHVQPVLRQIAQTLTDMGI